MAAEVLATHGAAVTVFDHMPSVGRKLLLAGRSGLNLTHGEPLDQLLDRYGEARAFLEPAIRAFPPDELAVWAASLGEPTFVGTSGRVFPASLRATPLLRAWLARLSSLGVEFRTRRRWTGCGEDPLTVRLLVGSGDPEAGRSEEVAVDAVVLALGGASWPRVGSTGTWLSILRGWGVEVTPLRASNCGVDVAWTDTFRDRFVGQPIKNAAWTVGGQTFRGEAVVTRTGLEGGAVYALGPDIRAALDAHGSATVWLDLHPDLGHDRLIERLSRRRPKDSVSTTLGRAGFGDVAAGLLREATGNRVPTDPAELAALAGAVPIQVVATRPLDRAISTAGGVALAEVDERYGLRRRPGVFVCGEMLDWDAPTGGYLLQASFSTAVAAARGALAASGAAPL